MYLYVQACLGLKDTTNSYMYKQDPERFLDFLFF